MYGEGDAQMIMTRAVCGALYTGELRAVNQFFRVVACCVEVFLVNIVTVMYCAWLQCVARVKRRNDAAVGGTAED